MKTITLLSRTITVDIDQLAKGIADMHAEKTEWLLPLKMGMLNARLMEMFEDKFRASTLLQFSAVSQMLYEDEIKQFIDDCVQEITKRIYHFANMDI